MRDENAERRGEARRLRRPVGEQRGRRDDERRASFARLLAEPQDEGEQLDGLAEPHVVGEAGAEAEFGEEAEPAHADILIGAQSGLQRLARIGGGERFRPAAAGERLGEPGARLHAPPGRVGRENFGRAADLGACQEPHRPAEGDAFLAGEPLDRVEPFERRLEPLVIDLDPFAPQHREPVGRGDQELDSPRPSESRRRG